MITKKSPVFAARAPIWVFVFAVAVCTGQTPADWTAPPEEQQTVSKTLADSPKHTNRLINSTSPYLLQHAHNPVDWYPWGEEAFAKARAEDKPIFLSVGYSSCHWCHVMERESFESEEIAAVLNEHFVSIKVDREERPDVDEIYMTAVQAMTGSGGWPMSVFLTPDLKPFYGGTYFPPEDRYGRPGFKTLLHGIAKAWKERRDDLHNNAALLTEHMEQYLAGRIGGPAALTPDIIKAAVNDLRENFDPRSGGFGPAPKFPSAPSIELLLREHRRTGDAALLDMATATLDRMALGGMYDHLGGGFARYSTDAEWLVPHFEKMLYDNAQLVPVYLEAWQVTKKPLYRRVVEETLNYVLRDMTDERGGFYSAEDADSEGEEGKFYLWTHDEILARLGEKDGQFFAAYYNVKKGGNFSSHEPYHAGKNILHLTRPLEELAGNYNLTIDELREKVERLKKTLFDHRGTRVRPGLDDKVLAAWNALMVSAFSRAYQVLDDDRYRDAAVRAARFILDEMQADGELLRTHRKGESRIPAYLEDYAYLIVALVDLYEATFDVSWLREADRLTRLMVEKFWDAEHGGFYFTSNDHANLIVRTRPTYDGATPSGNSMAAHGLLRLAKLLDKPDYHERAVKLLEANHAFMEKLPRGYLKMILAADFVLHPPREIALAGPRDSDGVRAFLRALHAAYVPNKVVALIDSADPNAEALGEEIPLLAAKTLVDGKPAAYVCKDYACKLPVTTPEAFLEQLGVTSGDA